MDTVTLPREEYEEMKAQLQWLKEQVRLAKLWGLREAKRTNWFVHQTYEVPPVRRLQREK